MSSSETYLFQNPQSNNLIDDAYERIGIIPPLVTDQKIETAQRSLNFILQSWINRGFNLWSMQYAMMGLTGSQPTYTLPPNTSDSIEVTLRQSFPTAVGGNPSSSTPLVTNQIATLQAISNAGGSLALTENPYVIYNTSSYNIELPVSLYSTANLSGITFTITGTFNGAPQFSTIPGPNNGNAITPVSFSSVTAISYTAGGGTPDVSAGLGNINNVFFNPYNGFPTTQTSPDGSIAYNWVTPTFTQPYAITLVGIESNTTQTYTLNFQSSNDDVIWTTVLSVPAQSYPAAIKMWFTIPDPISGNYFRVVETGGATLDLQRVYFNWMINDTWLNRISRREWMAFPQKNQLGKPNSYWTNRQPTNVTITLWPTPDNTGLYNCLFLTYVEMPQDIGTMTDYANIPARFLEALVSQLAYQLALKHPDIVDLAKVQFLKAHADEVFDQAAKEDSEDVPLRIYPDYHQGYLRD